VTAKAARKPGPGEEPVKRLRMTNELRLFAPLGPRV